KFVENIFRQRRIEIFRHAEEVAVPASNTFANGLMERNQPRYRRAIASDDNFFSCLDPRNQFREWGLRLMHIHGEHACRLTSGLNSLKPRNPQQNCVGDGSAQEMYRGRS